MFRFLPMAIGLLAIVGCRDRASAPRDASLFARELQSKVGQSFGPTRVRSIVAEGYELVITLDGAAGWRAGEPIDTLSADFLRGFCMSPGAVSYFAEGRTMRVDFMETGAHSIRGNPVSRCPP